MNITLQTSVAQPCEQVWEGFGQELFEALAPPFPPVRLQRFDGNTKGDEVHLELDFLLFRQAWHSRITAHRAGPWGRYFVDEGVRLPFFLKYWRHCHRLRTRPDGGTDIVDEIEYRTPTRLTDYLLYPVMYAQFWYRKPIYRRIFNRVPMMQLA